MVTLMPVRVAGYRTLGGRYRPICLPLAAKSVYTEPDFRGGRNQERLRRFVRTQRNGGMARFRFSPALPARRQRRCGNQASVTLFWQRRRSSRHLRAARTPRPKARKTPFDWGVNFYRATMRGNAVDWLSNWLRTRVMSSRSSSVLAHRRTNERLRAIIRAGISAFLNFARGIPRNCSTSTFRRTTGRTPPPV
jgi:hypothetical protein